MAGKHTKNQKYTRRALTFWASLLTATCALAAYLWPIDREHLVEVFGSDQRLGFINADGRVVVDMIWTEVGPFDEKGMAPVRGRDSKCGWIDRHGRVVIPLEWDHIGKFGKDDLARIFNGNLSGWINRDGEVVVDPVWNFCGREFDSEGMVRVMGPRGVGYIDRHGTIIVQPEWNWISPFGESGTAAVEKDGKWGCVDRRGNLLVSPEFQRGRFNPKLIRDSQEVAPSLTHYPEIPFTSAVYYIEELEDPSFHQFFDSEGMALIEGQEGNYGWIDLEGRVVIEAVWNDAQQFDQSGMAAVMNSGAKWGWIDRSGKVVIQPNWDRVRSFDSEGMAQVSRNGKHGWIDRDGIPVIPLEWDDVGGGVPPIENFGNRGHTTQQDAPARFDAEGWVRVMRSDKWGWVDRTGEVVIEPRWDSSGDFDEAGMAPVSSPDSTGWINRKGDLVISRKIGAVHKIQHHNLGRFDFLSFEESDSEGTLRLNDGDHWGMINRNGETVIPFEYDSISGFDRNGLARVTGGKRSQWQEVLTPQSIDELLTSGINQFSLRFESALNWGSWIDRTGADVLLLPGPDWNWYMPKIVNSTGDRYPDYYAPAYAYVAVNPLQEPNWLTRQYQKLNEWIGGNRATKANLACNAYDPNGNLIWSNRWVRFEVKCLLVMGVSLLLVAITGLKMQKARRGKTLNNPAGNGGRSAENPA